MRWRNLLLVNAGEAEPTQIASRLDDFDPQAVDGELLLAEFRLRDRLVGENHWLTGWMPCSIPRSHPETDELGLVFEYRSTLFDSALF